MRSFIYTAGILIVLGIAWTLYLNYDVKKFKSTLPKASETSVKFEKQINEPPIDSSKQNGQGDLMENLATLHDENTGTNNYLVDESQKLPSQKQSGNGHSNAQGEQEFDLSLIPIESHDEAEVSESPVGACGEICEPVDIKSLSENEHLELWRKDLQKRFGNIREVDLFIEHMELASSKKSVSESKMLEYVQATATLFPNEANLNHLKEMEMRVIRNSTER